MSGILYTAQTVKSDGFWLRAAMLFTLAADYFLLIYIDEFIGLCLFCCAQTAHHIRFAADGKFLGRAWPLNPRIIIQISAGALIIILPLPFDTVTKLAAVYAAGLICAAAASVKRRMRLKSRQSFFAMLGMVLFLCCDINVMLFNLTGSGAVYEAAYVLIWVFYLPSQILLSISEEKNNHREVNQCTS
ncbi:MAG: lysoplasmalogenase family protein [Defluviitaleaceae bacterium]|nr:lysoplasmalogenase family protein [Defluviitaleaceae bacterium]